MTVTNSIVGSEVFLQNDFLSLGINAYGGLGTSGAAPKGTATYVDGGYLRVGLYADLDGFGRGAETTLGDAVLRGTAVEGFNIGYKTGGNTYIQSNQSGTGLREIAGKTANVSSGSVGQATFKGATTENLKVDQTMTLVDGAKYIRVDVTLTNSSSATMSDLRYMRTVDPDQGKTMVTENKIVMQGAGEALVTASTGGGSPFFLYADDSRAVVSTYGFINESPYAAAAHDAAQQVGYAVKADQTVNLTFDLDALKAGQSTKLTFFMGLTNDLTATLKAIAADVPATTTPRPVAPDAMDDAVSAVAGQSVSGNVLSNDVDPQARKLTATLESGPAHGTVKLAADGSFTYTAAAGYTGSDTFSYAAVAGGQTDVATVRITTTAPPTVPTGLPDAAVLNRAGTLDGLSSAAQVLTGVSGANSFFFDIDVATGKDRITNFGQKDVLVTDRALLDSNGDGKIGLSMNTLQFDTSDSVKIDGVAGLRFMGSDDGVFVYADLAVRPKASIEGTLGNDVMTGGVGDKAKNTFFFDTALGIDLGDDKIINFGAKDLLLTTAKLADAGMGETIKLSGGLVSLTGVNGADLGSVSLTNTNGATVGAIEFDGTIVRGETTYYVYSTDGSLAGIGS